jgi:hypothetical protein
MRIASRKICLCNRLKLHASQRIVGMFSKIIPAFPPPLEVVSSKIHLLEQAPRYTKLGMASF